MQVSDKADAVTLITQITKFTGTIEQEVKVI